MNIVFPMVGRGERFAREGFREPKPMIPVCGKPIVQHSLESFTVDAQYIFIVRQEHLTLGLGDLLQRLRPGAQILPIAHDTEGSACTVLLAKEWINSDRPLLIADCDSVLTWPDRWVFEWFMKRGATGGVTLRLTNNPACSYAAIDTQGWVRETREKDPFTNFSTTGPYWWRHGRDFIACAEKMIAENRRTTGEFYVCPMYNAHIATGGQVLSYFLPEFWSLGTPQDVAHFIRAHSI